MCVECGFVQAVCDARKRFIFVAMDMPGSTHDSSAFGFSALWAALDAGLVAEGFYLKGCIRTLTGFVKFSPPSLVI